jgi:serine/threonine protein kinase
MDNFLGEGAYGKVYKKNNNIAAKQFDETRFAIHEYCIGHFLKNCPYTVPILGIDLEKKEVYMKLFKGSLSMWLQRPRSEAQMIVVLREILYGLCFYGDMRLVHADIKPGNILCDWNPKGDITQLVIGDTGFLSLEGFSKVHNTTPSYRDQNFKSDFRHDIFSLGILIITMFGGERVKGKKSYQELAEIAKKNVKNPHILEWTLKMISENRAERPTARSLLKRFFNITPPLQCHPGFPVFKNNLQRDQIEKIQAIFRERSPQPNEDPKSAEKRAIIYRSKIAYEACITYINKKKIHEDYHILYACATVMIFSSVFGKSGYTIRHIMSETGLNSQKALKAVNQLITDEDFITVMFYSKKSCMGN